VIIVIVIEHLILFIIEFVIEAVIDMVTVTAIEIVFKIVIVIEFVIVRKTNVAGGTRRPGPGEPMGATDKPPPLDIE
jgi:hypothetical protein